MKNSLFALALVAFVGTTAFAHEKPGKGKKEKKECTKGSGCCMKGGAKATASTAAKMPAATKSL